MKEEIKKPHQTKAGGTSRSSYKGKSGLGITRFHYGVPVVEEEEELKERSYVGQQCSRCGSHYTYYRFKSKTQRCRACGCEWKPSEEDDLEKSP